MKIKDPCAYSVYAYVFDDGHTYVGLTRNLKKRALGHKCEKSAVFRFWAKSGQKDFPLMLVLYGGMSSSEAQRTEDILVNCIEPAKRINRAMTGIGSGSLGGHANWTEEEQRYARERRSKKNRAYAKDYHRKHRERILTKQKAYRQDHREKIRKLAKDYAELHKAEKREYHRIYWKKHKKELSRKNKEYYRAHLKELRERAKIYASLHRDEKRKYNKLYDRGHIEEKRARNRIYKQKHREELRQQAKEYRLRKKLEKREKSR